MQTERSSASSRAEVVPGLAPGDDGSPGEAAPHGAAGWWADSSAGSSRGGEESIRSGRWWRRSRLGTVLVAVVVVLVGYYGVTLWQVWSTGRSDQARSVDAIVVMGAAQYDGRPSPQLAARLDQVVALWPQELAPVVVATGGNLPGDRFTEAEASARYLVERGVPESAILLENEGSSTYDSLMAVAEMLDGRGDRILIVTDPYHALRSRLTAEEAGLTAFVSPTDSSVIRGRASLERHLKEAGGIAVGRLIGFDRLSALTD